MLGTCSTTTSASYTSTGRHPDRWRSRCAHRSTLTLGSRHGCATGPCRTSSARSRLGPPGPERGGRSRFDGAVPIDLRREFDLPTDSVVLVMVANFRRGKDHPTLFRAIAELPDHLRDPLRVVLCGSAASDEQYHRRCMELAGRVGVADHLVVAGTRPDAPGVLAGADGAVCVTSKNESGPLVHPRVHGGRAAPFVASDTGEIADAVRDLGVGFLAEPRDHEDAAAALAGLLTLDDGARRAMGARAKDLVRDPVRPADLGQGRRRGLRRAAGHGPLLGRSSPGHGIMNICPQRHGRWITQRWKL